MKKLRARAKGKTKSIAPAKSQESTQEVKVPKEYAQVASRAHLRLVRMLKMEFDLRPSFFAEEPASLDFGREVLAHDFSQETSTTVFKWWFSATRGGEDVLTCRCSMLVSYSNVEGCDEDAVFEFAQRVGGLASFPYFRAIVAQNIWAAGISLPPMPTVRAGDFPCMPLKDFRKGRKPKGALVE